MLLEYNYALRVYEYHKNQLTNKSTPPFPL